MMDLLIIHTVCAIFQCIQHLVNFYERYRLAKNPEFCDFSSKFLQTTNYKFLPKNSKFPIFSYILIYILMSENAFLHLRFLQNPLKTLALNIITKALLFVLKDRIILRGLKVMHIN